MHFWLTMTISFRYLWLHLWMCFVVWRRLIFSYSLFTGHLHGIGIGSLRWAEISFPRRWFGRQHGQNHLSRPHWLPVTAFNAGNIVGYSKDENMCFVPPLLIFPSALLTSGSTSRGRISLHRGNGKRGRFNVGGDEWLHQRRSQSQYWPTERRLAQNRFRYAILQFCRYEFGDLSW